MAQSKIVVRFQDGRVLKGFTSDFLPTRERFHLSLAEDGPASELVPIDVASLKAVFFVNDFQGNPERKKIASFDVARPTPGRRVRVRFRDGEVLMGTTQGYQPQRRGFFVIPADPDCNNERCFVVTAATEQVELV